MIYIILIIFGLGASAFGAWAWNKLGKMEDGEEKDRAKKQYQIIAGVLGAVAILIASILVFTMF